LIVLRWSSPYSKVSMSTDMITPGMVIAGRYRIVKQLGEGGVGAVFLVQHVHTDERLALKVLHTQVAMDPTTIERFRTEARAPARIDSDHIVRVTDADVAPELKGAPFLVMEYLRGRDLGAEGEARKSLHPKEVVLYLRQTARALDKAHGIGIVHRDLKPENIFLTVREDGTPCVKLLDFGIAKLTGASASGGVNQSKTKTGAVFGTPLYMAPEQARAQAGSIGPHTDVWALGLIATRLLMGTDFWQAETLSDLIVKIVVDPIPPPSQQGCTLGPAFDAWFLRCCQRDHTQRFRSAGEAVSELATALGITEGPHLVVDVTEILQKARSEEGFSSQTITGMPITPIVAQSASPMLTTPSTPILITPAGSASDLRGTAAMGSTMLASETSAVPLGQTNSGQRKSSSRLVAIVAGAVLVVGLIGIAAFYGFGGNGSRHTNTATNTPPIALPSAMQKPTVETTTATTTESPPPLASEQAAASASAAEATTIPTTRTTSKSIPTGTSKTKKSNDDDLMSGRK
jgi:eukaryotic-like serine/threonine-protein kinase